MIRFWSCCSVDSTYFLCYTKIYCISVNNANMKSFRVVMAMQLKCVICGGNLTIQAGGTMAVCDVCGIGYSTDRLRELINIPSSTKTDLEHLWSLFKTYYSSCDFDSAFTTIKKLLEIVPSDEQALKWYNELQDFKFFDIRNGELLGYRGRAENIVIPGCVKKIGNKAFSHCEAICTVVLRFGIEKIGEFAFHYCENLHSVKIPNSVASIGDYAFGDCKALQYINIPEGVEEIKLGTFYGCWGLKTIDIPNSVKIIEQNAFIRTGLRSIHIPDSVVKIERTAFWDTPGLATVELPRALQIDDYYDVFNGCLWFEKQREKWKHEGKCIYCGGKVKGLFNPKCTKCDRTQ